MAYSPDYRELIISKLNEGATYRALERDYKLSRTTILKWKKDISRKLRIAKPTKIDNEKLKEDVALYPDDYQYERAVRFNCSQRAIGTRVNIGSKSVVITPAVGQSTTRNSTPSS